MARSARQATPRDPPASLGRVLDFVRLLWAVDHELTSSSKRMERRVGITGPQRFVVRIVGQHPGISAGALARTLHIHPGTLTGILKRLVARGALRRSPDPADGRRALFELTAKGLQIDAVRAGTIEAGIRKALGSLPAEDIEVAARVLARIAETLAPER